MDDGRMVGQHDPRGMPVSYTVFDDVFAKTAKRKELTWGVMADAFTSRPPEYPSKKACPLLKLATFGDAKTANGSLRHDANMLEVHGVEADYDGEKVSVDQAVEMLRSYSIEALVYTSPSHKPEAPRWRVLAPLAVTRKPEERAGYVARLNWALGGILAPESFTTSQTYYFGRVKGAPYEAQRSAGRFLDQLPDLGETWSAERKTKATAGKAQKLSDAAALDPVAQHLLSHGMVKRTEKDGRLHITCPFEDQHTAQTADSSTSYFPAHTGGFVNGHFACLHSHCLERTDEEFKAAIGYTEQSVLSQFEVLAAESAPTVERPRFGKTTRSELLTRPGQQWFIEGVLPRAEVVMLFGASTAGKSFMAWDMALAVARGASWRGLDVEQGKVAYVALEGRDGLPYRWKAYEEHHGLQIDDSRFWVIERDAPNLLKAADAIELARQIKAEGGADLIIVDTLAGSMPGGNENGGEDMGLVVHHCRGIRRATGATVMLIHHSGKDEAKGARGWSGLRAAVDAELEVVRSDQDRALIIGKQKDAADGGEFGFKLVVVEVGVNEKGKPITSCVVQHNDQARPVQRARMGTHEKQILRALDRLLGLTDEAPGSAELLDEAKSQMGEPANGKKDRRGFVLGRALAALTSDGVLRIEAGRVFRGQQ
jgi:hypothetical protein